MSKKSEPTVVLLLVPVFLVVVFLAVDFFAAVFLVVTFLLAFCFAVFSLLGRAAGFFLDVSMYSAEARLLRS